ncbi:MAG: hypothetical protein K2O14_07070 [Oscillospiraceae bacterium]|nr:hypothetical protein [Oscillospiraceae bacterium]
MEGQQENDNSRAAEEGADFTEAEKLPEDCVVEEKAPARDKKSARKAAARRFWITVRVWAAYFGYLILFVITFAVMLLFLTMAAVGIPMGIIFGVFGVAIELFKADFIITELAPELMIFGGLTAACGTAFCGLLAVKAGFMVSRLFLKIKKRCDRLRGW